MTPEQEQAIRANRAAYTDWVNMVLDIHLVDALLAELDSLRRELREAQQEMKRFKADGVPVVIRDAKIESLEQQLHNSEQERERLQSALKLAEEALGNVRIYILNSEMANQPGTLIRRAFDIIEKASAAIAKLETQ